jgi:sugar transferase (PEP-CTERM/EpsH1 system associated)
VQAECCKRQALSTGRGTDQEILLKILWIKTELLHPVDKGGKIRTYEMLKQLKRDHQVTYLSLDDGTASPAENKEAREKASEYCHKLVTIPHQMREKFSAGFYVELVENLFSRLPYAVKKYESAAMRQEILRLVAEDKPDVVVCDFLTPSINVPENLGCATVLFQHNVEAMIWQRHYETQTNPLKRLYLYGQWLKTRTLEKAECHRYDHVIAVSREDAEMMQRDYGVKSVTDVPTGVNTEFFRPQTNAEPEPASLVFTGSMDWLPNVDAINWFCDEVLPLIRAKVPNVKLTVVGRKPGRELLELSERDSSVVVTGRVDDVRPYIENAAAYIVPIRIGGGTRLKIYEALAMEKPMVSTTVGAEGLPLRDGEELLIADTPAEFADAVVRVLADQAFASELGQRAATTVRERFGWERVAAVFAEICQHACDPRTAEFDLKAASTGSDALRPMLSR